MVSFSFENFLRFTYSANPSTRLPAFYRLLVFPAFVHSPIPLANDTIMFMQSMRIRLNQINPLTNASVFGLIIVLPLPILLFSAHLPNWIPALAVGLLLAIFLLRGMANGRLLGFTPADFPLVILLALIPLNLWATPDISITLPRIYALIANIAIFWAVAAQHESRWLPFSAWALLAAGLVIGGFTLLGTNFTDFQLPFINQAVHKAIPTLWRPFWNPAGMNPNLSGGLLALFWPPAFIFLIKGPGWPVRLAGGITMAFLTAMLLLAQSRGAALGILTAVIILTILLNWRWLMFWIISAAIAFFALPQLFPSFAFANLLNDGAAGDVVTLAARLEIWSRTLYMIQDFPFTGVGHGMVEPVIRILYPLFLINPNAVVGHAHNIYLHTAAEMGLPALVVMLAFYLLLLLLPLKRLRQTPTGRAANLSLALFGTIIVYLTHGLVEVITYAPRGAIIVWGLFGLLVAVTTSHTLAADLD